ncbi:histidine kinase dimerization/phospho-acceptor domain-containing protein [Peribacillus tepidiphilus]|uniref:histidine kinase dimerization/phospho-acceptor domain-containing protein n=1 Tax=Peribacillus tepidiphilus TaxID=2652445 RepID=UPI0035B5206F
MDIKWKNNRMIAVWFVLFIFGLSSVFFILTNNEYMRKDYFHSMQFEDELRVFTELLAMFELLDETKAELKNNITVTREEIDEHRFRYGTLSEQIANIKAQYEGKIADALAANSKEVAEVYQKERDEKIQDITKNFKSDEHVKAKIVKEKEQQIEDYFNEIERQRPEFLEKKKTFKYYLLERDSGKIYTNLNISSNESVKDYMNDQEMLFIRSYPDSSSSYLTVQLPYIEYADLNQLISSKEFEGYIAIPKSAPKTSNILQNYENYQKARMVVIGFSIAGIIALLICWFSYKKVHFREGISKWKVKDYYNKLPVDVRSVILVFSFLSYHFSMSIDPFFLTNDLYYFVQNYIWKLCFSGIFLALTAIQLFFLAPVYRDGEILKDEWNKSFIVKVARLVKQAFLYRSVGTQMLLLLGIIYAAGFGLGIVFAEPHLIIVYLLLFIIFCIPTLFILLKTTAYLNRILKHTNELARGNYEPDLPVKGKSVLATLAGNINTLKHGVKALQREQAKSERLKTELITNVSHDLRTPLTSIITYSELLKSPDLTEEDRKAYVEIIDRKSKRLKVLIDDLFEASKMASGNIELVKEKVDIVQLLQQALAEYDESIQKSTLHFRISNLDQPVYAYVDGQKLWRVFDNLIGNILKYALENTRVYISLKTDPHRAIITFKNVTKFELGDNVDELFERFKRGDTSRHTDGSGLGLAIAKSIVDLHEGNLEIDVDGDLFKVTVELARINQ